MDAGLKANTPAAGSASGVPHGLKNRRPNASHYLHNHLPYRSLGYHASGVIGDDMKQIDYNSLEIDGIDYSDAPDFSDAYFCYGEYTDGTPLTDQALQDLSCSDLKYEHVYKEIGT